MRAGIAFRWILAALLVVTGFVHSVAAKYGGGTGQFDAPYLIYTAEQMNAIGAEPNDWDKHFCLMADVDLSGFDGRDGRPGFQQIAPDADGEPRFEGKPFTGVLDGNGHTISHLSMTGGHFLGLFGQLESTAVVMDLRMTDVTIDSTGDYVGAIAGWSFGHVTRCSGDGTVRGHTAVGGLVGHNWAVVSQCSVTGQVEGDSSIGGLTGSNSGAVIQCYSTSDVNGVEAVGGLVGSNAFGQMAQCYSAGAVSGAVAVGGLTGESSVMVTSCFWDIETSGQPASAAGTGLTTSKMHDVTTYRGAAWDWVGETEHGTSEIWQEPQGGGYPVLAAFDGYPSPRLQGRGEPGDPYLIRDAQELGAIVRGNPRAHYRLEASLDLSNIHWTTAVIPWFGGTFDGHGRTVSNLTITGGGHLGLFGQLALGARVANLGIVDANIVGSGNQIGSLAGWNLGPVTCCYSSGSVSGVRRIGGLIGYNWGVVTQCYNTSAVFGTSDVGGLVGYGEYGDVTCCYSIGVVTGGWDVGGLVGRLGPLAGLARCFWDIETSGQIVDAGSIGLPTPQMQVARTFLAAHWDFVGESRSGTEDFWWIVEGHSYPRLWWEPAEQP